MNHEYNEILSSAQRKIEKNLNMGEALKNYSTEREKQIYFEGVEHGIRFMISSYGNLEHCLDDAPSNGLDDSD